MSNLPIINTMNKVAQGPINTRTFLFHPTRPEIVIEGIGDSDAARLQSLAAQIAAKKKLGYSTERFHGQHPHSFDNDRVDFQTLQAEAGDEKAKEALAAKSLLKEKKADEDAAAKLAADNDALRLRLAQAEQQLEAKKQERPRRERVVA